MLIHFLAGSANGPHTALLLLMPDNTLQRFFLNDVIGMCTNTWRVCWHYFICVLLMSLDFQVLDAQLMKEMNQALDSTLSSKKRDIKKLTVHFSGISDRLNATESSEKDENGDKQKPQQETEEKTKKKITISYTIQNPIWKTSYRIALPSSSSSSSSDSEQPWVQVRWWHIHEYVCVYLDVHNCVFSDFDRPGLALTTTAKMIGMTCPCHLSAAHPSLSYTTSTHRATSTDHSLTVRGNTMCRCSKHNNKCNSNNTNNRTSSTTTNHNNNNNSHNKCHCLVQQQTTQTQQEEAGCLEEQQTHLELLHLLLFVLRLPPQRQVDLLSALAVPLHLMLALECHLQIPYSVSMCKWKRQRLATCVITKCHTLSLWKNIILLLCLSFNPIWRCVFCFVLMVFVSLTDVIKLGSPSISFQCTSQQPSQLGRHCIYKHRKRSLGKGTRYF